VKGVAVSIINTETNEIIKFTNQTEAGQYLGVTRQAIYGAIKRGKLVKGIYLIIKK
jgi:DNA-binding XRE family transcriptional regulator